MNRAETLKIMSLFRAAYPKFYEGKGKQELENIVTLWQEMFDEPYLVVANAVKALISTDTKGFPPVIGQVKEKIRMLTHEDDMTAVEAWSYVSKALRNSSYGSKEEFEKLPEIVQAVVHSPDQLQEWAGMDVDTVQSVISSNFQRSFNAKAQQAREWQALPEEVKDFHRQVLETITKPMPELPEKDEVKLIAMRDDKIRRTQLALEVKDELEQAIVKDFSNIPLPGKQEPPSPMDTEEFEKRREEALKKLRGL